MPTRKKKVKAPVKATFEPRHSPVRLVPGTILVAVSLLFGVALLDYAPAQPGWIPAFATSTEPDPVPNLIGRFGRDAAFLWLWTFGMGSLFALFSILWTGVLFFARRAHLVNVPRSVLILLSWAGLAGLLANYEVLADPQLDRAFPENYLVRGLGGVVGYGLGPGFLLDSLGSVGSSLLFSVFFVAGLIALFADPSRILFSKAFSAISTYRGESNEREASRAARAETRETRREERERRRAEKLRLREIQRQEKERLRREKEAARGAEEAKAKPKPIRGFDSELLDAPILKRRKDRAGWEEPESSEAEKDPPRPQKPSGRKRAKQKEEEAKAESGEEDDSGFRIVAGEKVERAEVVFPPRKGDYQFPSLDLLQDIPEARSVSPEEHRETAEALRQTLAEFGVNVELGEVHTGPVITRYEVYPAAGVRVEKIVNLAKNIGMALRAESVRILAPVPGKGCVGIEVPNRKPSAVCLREIIESRSWADSEAEIPVVLGKEVSGKPLVTDLTRMPHLLIAGSTGSGKTVCINSIIASLLYHSSPDDLRFIMVDPKIVEMQVYNSLPHMLIPVVTDPKKVPAALKWLISEMERRYHIFAKAGVRNIAGFNAKILRDREERRKAEQLDLELSAEERAALLEAEQDGGEEEIPREKLPYIVCIIDELADLMMVAPADIETNVARLAQLARAAGIHLVIATQRPSVNVITGIIKANLPSRIAFKVASKVDSRTILDEGGADALIGKGDMLFIPPGAHTLVRAQGAFVSDEEINGIVEFLKVNGPPAILESVQAQVEAGEEGAGGGVEGEFDDDMVPQAIEVIRATKRASTSMLQRRLRIGYNRAARIMDLLEEEGYVGPDNGAQPREILMDD